MNTHVGIVAFAKDPDDIAYFEVVTTSTPLMASSEGRARLNDAFYKYVTRRAETAEGIARLPGGIPVSNQFETGIAEDVGEYGLIVERLVSQAERMVVRRIERARVHLSGRTREMDPCGKSRGRIDLRGKSFSRLPAGEWVRDGGDLRWHAATNAASMAGPSRDLIPTQSRIAGAASAALERGLI